MLGSYPHRLTTPVVSLQGAPGPDGPAGERVSEGTALVGRGQGLVPMQKRRRRRARGEAAQRWAVREGFAAAGSRS